MDKQTKISLPSQLESVRLSTHFTLGELCKTNVKSLDGNVPGDEEIENLKRLCPWLEELRARYNQRYVLPEEEPIIITSGYRSPELNRKVGGSPTSNHLTGCAVDIRVAGIEQALRYAVILMDYADETKQDYDELLIERNKGGGYWLHFAVRPKDNRRNTRFIQT